MDRSMRAALLDHPGPIDSAPLVVRSVPVPEPREDEALIRVTACGICRTDLHVVEGELPARRSPVIPGHQVVGVVERPGPRVRSLNPGDRVGVAWLRRTCGVCPFCSGGHENLCDRAEFNGWTADGGFAEFITAPADFVYPIPAGFDDAQAAPLLCAGIIGYRSLRLTGLGDADRNTCPGSSTSWKGARLGLYGFGAAGHVVIQLARARGAEVYVCTRDRERHQALAAELGATWIGEAAEPPPVKLHASIIFAPAGELVPPALAALDKGGVLVLGGIHMSDIPSLNYPLIYGERVIRSVTNNTREDGREFLAEAAAIPVRTHVEVFDGLDRVNDALRALKHDAIKGAGVVRVSRSLVQ
ncbi:MAG TPA: zinc-dependent alcohol dehydrogenase family protein [Phycisphaerales bacterium]|nr:zinc-dependent alcohol dehydrogenase family protein [Phycisphaerales bacterium]